jgi:MerR family transcriptional regulator, copper efflux regulator
MATDMNNTLRSVIRFITLFFVLAIVIDIFATDKCRVFSKHTLRYYENFGLFNGQTNGKVKTNNYKNYDEDLVEKIKLIKEAKEIGFTLSEIKELLDNWFNKRYSIEKKVEILNAKIRDIDARIRQLKQVRKLLTDGIEDVRNGDC